MQTHRGDRAGLEAAQRDQWRGRTTALEKDEKPKALTVLKNSFGELGEKDLK